jgi:uncharacterized membrane protein
MTEPQTLPPSPSAPSRGLKFALVVSVALNLAVAGLVAGAWLGKDHHKGMPRDISFGPFSEALSKEDRRALRAALAARASALQTTRDAVRTDFETLLAALRAEPFDPEALKTAFSAIEDRNAERVGLGRSLLEEHLVSMSAAKRLAFAERLEKGLGHNPKKN